MDQTRTLHPAELVRIEARALEALAASLEEKMAEPFARALRLVLQCVQDRGRVIVTGMGKSGLVGRKIAATLTSTGSPAIFLHPAEAVHGDAGILTACDVILALSASGETEELVRLLPLFKRKAKALISFCRSSDCSLAAASDVVLEIQAEREACALDLVPTASSTAMLALGDALAIAASQKRGFRREDFAELHPGGGLGRKLAPVSDLMHSGTAIPSVDITTPMPAVIYEMSRKRLGITLVTESTPAGGRLAGIISDGDLRRFIEREGAKALSRTAGEAMNPTPKVIAASELAVAALKVMENNKITSLVALDDDGQVAGILHIHDLWSLQLPQD